MYPYMKNQDLRYNIDRVNQGKEMSHMESNSKIWTRCIYQMIQAVDFLHRYIPPLRKSVFHRDLTSRNILLDVNFNVRIGDFGIAVEAKGNLTHATQTRLMGTDGYHPPNMDPNKYHASYDVFSVGVVVLEILTGLEAKLDKKPGYLYKKYSVSNTKYLSEDLDDRAIKNKAAVWAIQDYRKIFEKIALRAVDLNASQPNITCLLQTLEDEMRLDQEARYIKPTNLERCLSCCVNPIAKLSTKGRDCIPNDPHNPCQYFCTPCLMNHHLNPLVCPIHGKTRPPFGDHVYGVFVAGNDVHHPQHITSMQGTSTSKTIAQIFVRDVEKVFKVLTSRHPFVLGVSESNIRIVKPVQPGTEDNMEPNIKKAFEEINDTIIQAIKKYNLDPEKDRLPNSLFIFYFSGHCSKDKGLQLGSTEENLKASNTWIQEMIHMKLAVDQIGIVLDCCHAESQNFTVYLELNTEKCKFKNKKVSIVQLSSCDIDEKSSTTPEGSVSNFTNLFCQGLLGLDTKEDDEVVLCENCEKRKTPQTCYSLPCGQYQYQCEKDYGVSFYAMKTFIQGHCDLLKADVRNPVISTQREKEVFLAYYNPYKLHIAIHIKGSNASQTFIITSQIDSMDTLRQSIMNPKGSCDVLNLDTCMGLNSSRLIAIYPKHGRNKDCELTSLDSIYMARSCGCDLEARVREHIPGIPNGPVKLNNVNATMVRSSETSFNKDHLKIDQSLIQIPVKTIHMAEEEMRKMKRDEAKYPKAFILLISEIMKTIRTLNECSLLGNDEHVLKFNLNTNFSVLSLD